MKRLFPFLIIILLVNNLTGQVNVGIMGGGSLSDEVEVRGAVLLEWMMNKYIGFRVEPAFTIRGNHEVVRKIDISPERSAESLSYFELAILSKFTLPFDDFRPYAVIGLQAGYGIGVRSSYIDGPYLFKEKYSFDQVKLDPVDGGITFGVGIEKEIRRNRKIFADFRYYLGLVNFDEDERGDIFNAGKVFSIGFAMPITTSSRRTVRDSARDL